jgi:hypothetical protein
MSAVDAAYRLLKEHAATGTGLAEAIAILRDLKVPEGCLLLRNAATSAVLRWEASGAPLHRMEALHYVEYVACWLDGWDAARNST